MLRTLATVNKTIFGNSSADNAQEDEMATHADKITLSEFKDALSRYPALIKSFPKSSKEGAPSLEELDRFRYVDAPSRFSKKAGGKTLGLADVQKLVEWKLRHGTFRPSLTKLLASNSDEKVEEATKEAFAYYNKNPTDISKTIEILTTPLKGIGPSAGSLILAVHDPENVIFFSDEAYRWLVKGGDKTKILYNVKEFEELYTKAKAFQHKLKVSPIDIEKAAYVLIKENEPVHVPKPKKEPSGRPRGRPALPESEKKIKKPTVPGRGRGRPKGAIKKDATPKTPNGEGKKRGRPAAASGIETHTPKSGKRKATEEAEPKSGKKSKA